MASTNQAARGIASVIDGWARAWNAHDMLAAAALVTPDVDFVTVAGLWLKGRDEFLRHHCDIHARHMRATTWTTLGYEHRLLHQDLALTHLKWSIAGEFDGNYPRPTRLGVFTWVVAGVADTWSIAAAHNTNLRADTSHRLGRRGASS